MHWRKLTISTSAAVQCLSRNGPDSLDDFLPATEMLWEPTETVARKSVADVLVDRGHLSKELLVQTRQVAAKTPGKSLVHVLLAMNAASEAQVLSALAETLGLAFEQPTRESVDATAFALLPADYMRKRGVAPLRFNADRLVLGVVDPNDIFLLDEVCRKTNKDLTTVVTTTADIQRLIEEMTAGRSPATKRWPRRNRRIPPLSWKQPATMPRSSASSIT
jgi:hypothetical protein